jgi:hypothetical protein
MHPSRLLLAASFLLAGCATSSNLMEDRLTEPAAITAVELGTVRFDYAKWTTQDADQIATARKHEAEWSKALGEAFVARAQRRGLGGDGPRSRIDVTITDLDPGSRSARMWVGFGAGSGRITAEAQVAEHGSFRMSSKISGGAWGGNFAGVMEELGASLAEHIAKRRT